MIMFQGLLSTHRSTTNICCNYYKTVFPYSHRVTGRKERHSCGSLKELQKLVFTAATSSVSFLKENRSSRIRETSGSVSINSIARRRSKVSRTRKNGREKKNHHTNLKGAMMKRKFVNFSIVGL